ncbi:uncharacterized protein LOC129720363 [Wyeomyia smithii]|uniref:uncharacterized protein LOC129720363 n=1 Tax=Wyeomyia smithii TaxID=174621 RepID=UPI002467FA87|nr:uncharacterized protein LOC129720363 [Wyeomyia smithii]
MDDSSGVVDRKKCSGVVFLDLSKAFDTINHDMLLKKLEAYGVRGLPNDFIRSYLSNRQQQVVIPGGKSDFRDVSCGVPQGSNIGPLFLLVYVNDIAELKLNGTSRLFADDTAISYAGSTAGHVISDITQDLQRVVAYLENNLLALNLSKTKMMIFSTLKHERSTHQQLVVNDRKEHLFSSPFRGDVKGIIKHFVAAAAKELNDKRTYHSSVGKLQVNFLIFSSCEQSCVRALAVTYGLAPSSFLATRTLKQLADDEGESFPLAAEKLKHSFYMDDFISGASDVKTASQLCTQMVELLSLGGFRLRKWCCNFPEVLADLPSEYINTQFARSFDAEEAVKTLGISWEPTSDVLRFDLGTHTIVEPITKQSILSVIARLYDPLGLIAPIVVRAKVLMQHLWTLAIDWDEEVPVDVQFSSVWFWSDSMVVLHWLRMSPHTCKTFVANRIAEIQELTHNAKWLHVPGKNNPADLVSRGLSVGELVNSKLWKYGPEWLHEGEGHWPKQELEAFTTPPDEIPERKAAIFVIQTVVSSDTLINRFSSFHRMIRVIAYCLRFVRRCKGGNLADSVVLSVDEPNVAKTTLIKLVQREAFGDEIKQLAAGKQLFKRSSLRLLNPFLDMAGVIRVGGRLRLSDEGYVCKHLILLPGFHYFTRLLLMSIHLKTLHGGVSLTLAVTRNEFWPTNGRRAVRNTIHKCYRCIRANPQPIKQSKGQLPHARVSPSRPFSITRIDYCGPVFVKTPGRKASPIKAYTAIFVCFSTKAVHIELVGDLSTASFMYALRRFIARRGCPQQIFSDNGTNFAGAKNELHGLYRMLKNRTENNRIANSLATGGITWHTIPPRAPNFGGLWEAAVKVAKTHLRSQLGYTTLYYEDLVTILTQIEGCMNSRPLAPLSEDPNDMEVITPSHFLIGSSLLNRFQFVQQRVQQFCCRWRSEYLKELQRQSYINPEKVNLKVSQLVILKDQLMPPTQWPLARIEALYPGRDNISRVVLLRTSSGIFKRSSCKVCPLPCAFDEYDETSATPNHAGDVADSSEQAVYN